MLISLFILNKFIKFDPWYFPLVYNNFVKSIDFTDKWRVLKSSSIFICSFKIYKTIMNQINNQINPTKPSQPNAPKSPALRNVQNAVLKRLIEEVRNEGTNFLNGYDRTHSRHNRGR